VESTGIAAWWTRALVASWLLAAPAGTAFAAGEDFAPPTGPGLQIPPAPSTPAALEAVPPDLQPTAPDDGRIKGPYILVDVQSGEVLDHFDAVRPWYPASTTKLMTLYVAFVAIRAGEFTLESPVTITAHAAAEPASKMGFKPGTMLTLGDALRIMMVKSANDIAMAVAETIGGSQEGFAARMNAESQRLGMGRSHWVNPNGLPDPGQVTTARDMAVLSRALLQEFPEHRPFYSLHAIQFGKSVLENYNPLLERFPGANGMKTGFICASGYNLVASAQRGPREAIAVVFGEYSGGERAEHAAKLLTQAFQWNSSGAPPAITLATVNSGEAYSAPLDMRPFVCAPKQAATASDAPTPERRGVVKSSMTGDEQQDVSYLAPPMDLGPPVQVSIIVSGDQLAPGKPGFVARLPRPRPQLAYEETHPLRSIPG
jgi:D-alanyl-D-alanine carboxypeptidase